MRPRKLFAVIAARVDWETWTHILDTRRHGQTISQRMRELLTFAVSWEKASKEDMK